jgi:hypothetical protein
MHDSFSQLDQINSAYKSNTVKDRKRSQSTKSANTSESLFSNYHSFFVLNEKIPENFKLKLSLDFENSKTPGILGKTKRVLVKQHQIPKNNNVLEISEEALGKALQKVHDEEVVDLYTAKDEALKNRRELQKQNDSLVS